MLTIAKCFKLSALLVLMIVPGCRCCPGPSRPEVAPPTLPNWRTFSPPSRTYLPGTIVTHWKDGIAVVCPAEMLKDGMAQPPRMNAPTPLNVESSKKEAISAVVSAQVASVVDANLSANAKSEVNVESPSFAEVSLVDPAGVELDATNNPECQKRIQQKCASGAKQFQLVRSVIEETFNATVSTDAKVSLDASALKDLSEHVNGKVSAGGSSESTLKISGAKLFTHYKTDVVMTLKCQQ